MAQIKLLKGSKNGLGSVLNDDGQLLFTIDEGHIYLDTGTARIELYSKDLKTLTDAISVINGEATDEGSIKKAVADLKTTIEASLATVAKSGKAADVTIEDIDGKLEAANVEAALVEILGKIVELEKEVTGDAGSGDSDGTSLSEKVKKNTGDIAILNGDAQTEGSVAQQVATAVAGIVADAPAAYDTLKEIADYIASDTTGAATMAADIATLKGADTVEGSVAKTVKDAVEALDQNDTAVEGQYVASVSQADGVITVTRKTLPSLDGLEWGSFGTVESGD